MVGWMEGWVAGKMLKPAIALTNELNKIKFIEI